MRGDTGIDITARGAASVYLPRILACVLVAVAMLAGSPGGAVTAAVEEDGGESPGIDLPFVSRDDGNGPSFALTTYVCTPGDDTDLRDRLLVESSNDPEAFFEDGIELDELREVCAAPAEALTYVLTDLSTDETDARELGGDQEASYTWTDLSTSERLYTLGVEGEETYADPIVTCTVEGDPPGMSTQYYATDGSITFSSAEGRSHTCEWFNVDLGEDAAGQANDAGESGDSASPVAGPDGISTVAVRTHTCAVGDDADLLERIEFQTENWTSVDPVQGISLDELRETCDAPGEEIAFTVTNQHNGEQEEQVLGGDASDDYTSWEMEANVGHSVDADEPDGYGVPIVFCGFQSSGAPAGEQTPTPMAEGVLYVGMGAGTTFACDWFHVVTDGGDATPVAGAGGGNFALRAYTCSSGDDADLRARIAYQAENWTTVDPVDGITLDELREECAPADGSIPFTVTEDETGDRVELMVAGEDDAFADLTPLTSYTIAADEPDGYGEPLLFCALDGGEPDQSPIIDGDLYLILGEDVTDTCEWFHVDFGGVLPEVPGDDEDLAAFEDVPVTESDVVTAESSAISIRSYTCTDDGDGLPERISYQRENWIAIDPVLGVSLDELHETCELSLEEIAFMVTDQDSSEQVKKVVGGAENDGYVTWEVMPDASNTVDADEPAGYGEPLVFCAFHDTGEPVEDQTPSPMTDGLLNVGMSAGTTYTCDWFHIDLGDSNA